MQFSSICRFHIKHGQRIVWTEIQNSFGQWTDQSSDETVLDFWSQGSVRDPRTPRSGDRSVLVRGALGLVVVHIGLTYWKKIVHIHLKQWFVHRSKCIRSHCMVADKDRPRSSPFWLFCHCEHLLAWQCSLPCFEIHWMHEIGDRICRQIAWNQG